MLRLQKQPPDDEQLFFRNMQTLV